MESNQGKLAVLDEKRTFFIQSEDLPKPGPGEVLVQVLMATVCKSDCHTFHGHRDAPLPSVLGHEASGVVIGLPESPVCDINGQLLAIGVPVVWSIFAAPGEDTFALRGMIQKSLGVLKYGHQDNRLTPFSGGFASHILLRPGTAIACLSPEIPAAVAAPLNCSLATMVGAFRLGGAPSGASVAIMGCGMLGLHGLAYAKTKGFSKIVGVDIVSERRVRALSFGATIVYTFEEWAASRETFDLVIDTTGVTAAMEQSLEHLGIGGTAVWVGAVFPSSKVAIDPERIIRHLISIKGLHKYNESDFKEAVSHLEAHHRGFPFESLVNPIFPLEEIAAAFDWYEVPATYRVGIIPGANPSLDGGNRAD